MATTVNEAFRQFLADSVNLDPAITATARGSRDWLMQQLQSFHVDDGGFPKPYPEKDLHYGSFARRTRIRELDDIDIISGIHAEGSTYIETVGTITISVPEGTRLRGMCDTNTDQLNSRKVINRFVSQLEKVPQYTRAEVGRQGEAAVLFDIVPGLFTKPEADGRTFYLIPDARGRWKKTDPRIDQQRVTDINQRHDGGVLNPIRLVKYWNRRTRVPSVPSYLLECILLGHYESTPTAASKFPDLEIAPLLDSLAASILSGVHDPKGIQGDLNTLTWQERLAISAAAAADANTARVARAHEAGGNQQSSIAMWRDVFGDRFPAFG